MEPSPLHDIDAGTLEALSAAAREAESLSAELVAARAAATDAADDVAEVVASGALLSRLLADVDEAIRQVFTAGLSFPDPELPEELDALAERAARHGLPTALSHIKRLHVWLESISTHHDVESRHRYARGAWEETQKLLTWLRLFRSELDILTVEGNLAMEATGSSDRAVSRVPVRTSTVWPVGLELEATGKLIIFGFDIDAKMPVLLRDHLAEFDPHNPIGERAISRLFQDQIEVGKLMRGLIRLEDHPVVMRETSMLFRPAFRSIPRALPIADDFQPPELPTLDPDRSRGQYVPGPVTATVEAKSGRVNWAAPFPVASNDCLHLNALKLLARERTSSLDLELVARLQDDSLRLLSAETLDDGRVYIADDPTLFRLAPNVIASGAIETSSALTDGAVEGALLRSAAFLFGGAAGEAVASLRNDLDVIDARGVENHYLIGLSRFLLGDPIISSAVEEVVRDTLSIAGRTARTDIPLAVVSKVLGRPASAADVALVYDEDRLVYEALWLAFQADLVGAMEHEVRALAKGRYARKLYSVTPAAVCTRALVTCLVELLDGSHDAEDVENVESKAATFIEAHLADLGGVRGGRRRRRKRMQMSMPELLELFQLADTRAIVNGGDRRAPGVAALGLAPMTIARMCAKPLQSWRSGEPEPSSANEAAQALTVIAASGLRPYFVL